MSSDVKIAVIGAGAIGTSIGLALMGLENRPQLVVHDRDHGTGREAFAKYKAFDRSDWNLLNACEGADAVVLAIPAPEIRATLEVLAPHLKENAVVTDTSPTKKAVVDMAREVLPETLHFVGGHPIVSTAGVGAEHASATLFKDSLYCLTPAPEAHPDAVQFAQDLVTLLGANPFFLDPEEHDGLLSGVDHLPQVLGVALLNGVRESNSWQEMRRMAGQRFGHVSIGAVGDPAAMATNWLNNRENLLRWIDTIMPELDNLKEHLQNQDEAALTDAVSEAVKARHKWQEDYLKGKLRDPMRFESVEVEQPSLMSRLFGGMAPRRLRGDDR